MDMPKEVYSIFKEIENESSRIGKETILQNNKDNKLFSSILYFLYNPFIVTGLSSKKINKEVDVQPNIRINDIEGMMEYLVSNNTGRDIDIANIKEYIKDNNEFQEFIIDIATKSVKVGITDKTINKIYGKGYIPNFEPMLAKKYEEHSHKFIGKEYIATPKLDGIRVLYVDGKFLTRKGQEIEGLEEIQNEISLLNQNYVYDGELLAINLEGLKSKDLYRKTMKLSRTKGSKVGLEFHIFDMIATSDFKKGKSDECCYNRKTRLKSEINQHNLSYIKSVPILYIGKDTNKIQELLIEATNNDEEGVMMQLSDSPYACKRTDAILKVKSMNDCDLMIVGFEEGEGKYKGTLGRINVEYKGNIVGVGSGFSDNARNEIWANKDKYINRVAKIQYFEESKNQNNNMVSLRFPVFVEIREEGKEISYN